MIGEMIRDLQRQLNDIGKQLAALQRLDVNPPASSQVTYSGTPTAGQLAQWAGGGTVTQSGYAGSAVVRYSGAPSAGNFAYWTAAGTVADSGFGTASVATLSGTQTLTNKTLTTPTIGDFTNAAHTHADAAGGGTIDHGALVGRSDDDHTIYALADGTRTFTGQVTMSPSSTGDNALVTKLPASSTGYHLTQLDAGGTNLVLRVAQLYSSSIAISGGNATVFSVPFPINRAVVGSLFIVTAHRSSGNVQRHQTFQYSFAADVFAASIAGFTQTLIFSDNNSGQPATTVTIGASGTNMAVALTNNSTSKAITSVTCSAEFIATPNA